MKHVSAEGLRYLMEAERDTFKDAFPYMNKSYGNTDRGQRVDPILRAVTEERWKKMATALDKALARYLADE